MITKIGIMTTSSSHHPFYTFYCTLTILVLLLIAKYDIVDDITILILELWRIMLTMKLEFLYK